MVALLIGLVFGTGLIVSGMFDPRKVTGFLDIAGAWDPSLAVVMAVAVPVAALGYALGKRRAAPMLGRDFSVPAKRDIDARLVAGSIVFGVGWGLAGVCPAPGLLLASAQQRGGLVFVLAMIAGMLVFEIIERTRRLRATSTTPSPVEPSS